MPPPVLLAMVAPFCWFQIAPKSFTIVDPPDTVNGTGEVLKVAVAGLTKVRPPERFNVLPEAVAMDRPPRAMVRPVPLMVVVFWLPAWAVKLVAPVTVSVSLPVRFMLPKKPLAMDKDAMVPATVTYSPSMIAAGIRNL